MARLRREMQSSAWTKPRCGSALTCQGYQRSIPRSALTWKGYPQSLLHEILFYSECPYMAGISMELSTDVLTQHGICKLSHEILFLGVPSRGRGIHGACGDRPHIAWASMERGICQECAHMAGISAKSVSREACTGNKAKAASPTHYPLVRKVSRHVLSAQSLKHRTHGK